MYSRPKANSKIYRGFKAIDAVEYRSIIRYYEAHEKQFAALDFFEYYDMLADYTNALFQIGSYQKHILMATTLIETTILNNISSYKGKDIYIQTLFDKATSHFYSYDFPKAIYIVEELIKMNPDDAQSAALLVKCKLKTKPDFLKKARGISILLIFLTTLIIALEVLVIAPFFPNLHIYFERTRIATFILAIIVLASAEGWNHYQVKKAVKQKVEQNKAKKKINHTSF